MLLSTLLLAGCAASPAAGPESTPQPSFELSTLGVDSDLCKFEDLTPEFSKRSEWENFTYFPNVATEHYFLPNTGELNLALVFLDWEDKAGTPEDLTYYTEQTEIMSAWFQTVSQKNLALNWSVATEWNHLGGSWKDYARIDNENYGSDEDRAPWEQWLLDEAVKASDSSFDYSQIDYVVFAMPRSGSIIQRSSGDRYDSETVMTSGVQGMAYDVHEGSRRATIVKSEEKLIGNWVLSGTSFQDSENRSPSWVHWAHEMGHMLGYISHQGVPNQQNNAPLFSNTMQGVSLFADQWQVTRVVDTWTAWVAGWLEDSQVKCVNADDIQGQEIFAVESFRKEGGQTKSLIIRTGKTSGLVIESRDWNSEFDYSTRLSEKGLYSAVVMYKIDSSRAIADESLVALTPRGLINVARDADKWPGPATSFTDIYFHEGNSVEFEGLKIEPISLQAGVDYIKVTRIGK